VTTPAGDDGRGGATDLPASVVVAVTVLLIAVLAAIVYLTATGKPVTNVLLVLSSFIAPTIASFVAVHKLTNVQSNLSDVRSDVSNVKSDVSAVSGKVDSKIDNLIHDKSNLEQQVVANGITPVTATVSFDPESTGPMPRLRPSGEQPIAYPETQPAGVPAQSPRITAEEILKREGYHGR
jgi:hypothetical protein